MGGGLMVCFLLADINTSGHVGARTGQQCRSEPLHENTGEKHCP